jgi:hypothetical protein
VEWYSLNYVSSKNWFPVDIADSGWKENAQTSIRKGNTHSPMMKKPSLIDSKNLIIQNGFKQQYHTTLLTLDLLMN